MLATIAHIGLAIAFVIFGGLTLYAFGWRGEGNDTRRRITAEQPSVARPATVHNGGAGQSGFVPPHSSTDSAGEQQRVG